MPHSPRKRALREQARESGRSYAHLLSRSGMHNSVRIHAAKPSDLSRFFSGSAQPDMSRLWQLRDLLRRQTDGLGRLFVASTANACIGHLYVVLEDDGLRLPLLTYYWVRESRRRTGVATRLVTRAEQWLKMYDQRDVAALVDPSDRDAVRLYESLGYEYLYEAESYRDEFRPDGERIRKPMTLIIYSKRS